MGNNLNCEANGTSLFSEIEDDLKFWKMVDNINLYQLEDDLNLLANGRRPSPNPTQKTILKKKFENIFFLD
jgi:hypothetical protein